ncbi:MAG: clan AA aspartic protease [Bacteroidales bacterium]|nr:clan AA aspartic protease [Bacteroidales bacterium]MBN2750403.1 clan AA aspartic protease [Bacteroidales bacterium]
MRVKIPFELIEIEKHSFHPVIEVTIKDESYLFVIDTGASRTVIHSNLAAQFPPVDMGAVEPYAASITAESLPVTMVCINLLHIGSYPFVNTQAFSADLTSIASYYESMTGRKLYGLLGCDFMLKTKAVMNFPKKILTLSV